MDSVSMRLVGFLFNDGIMISSSMIVRFWNSNMLMMLWLCLVLSCRCLVSIFEMMVVDDMVNVLFSVSFVCYDSGY